ncbi:MAG: hypothetical protein WC010_02615 [Candidatus Absconditabacterales bacterium]
MSENRKLNSNNEKHKVENPPEKNPETQDVYTCSSGKYENKVVDGKTEKKGKKV